MTPRDSGTDDAGTVAATVEVRADGRVDDASLAYVRAKVHAALDRPGMPPLVGEVRVSRATAHHVEQPWSAAGEIRVGHDLVVVHADEASAQELGDRLQNRLRGQVDRLVHRRDAARRAAAPPPWRGGPADVRRDRG